jgi:division protein CdvB (Snf7/Vps24/ESCRT-III family)
LPLFVLNGENLIINLPEYFSRSSRTNIHCKQFFKFYSIETAHHQCTTIVVVFPCEPYTRGVVIFYLYLTLLIRTKPFRKYATKQNMNKLFGKPEQPTMRQTIRDNKRELDKEGRGMDRERQNLQMQEKKIQADIKQALKRGDEQTARMLAKQIVGLRKQQTRLMGMKGNMQSLGHKQTAMGATVTMTNAMKTSANVMGKMNKQMDAQEVMKVMGEFSKQNEMMGMKEEMMDDTIDSIFDDDADEADEAVDQIYDELGLQFGNEMSSVGGKSKLPSAKQRNMEAEDDEDTDDLLRRLGALK